jgi:hypothetical protein
MSATPIDQLTTAERKRERAVNFETNPQLVPCDENQLAITVGKLRAHLRQRNRERVEESIEEYFRTDPTREIAPRDLPTETLLCDVLPMRLSNALESVGIMSVGQARDRVKPGFRAANFSEKSVEAVMRAVGTWKE